jgi:mRNA-degrading endonuclease YafQ of YafQ-DinJ toxin-antitoxin module
MLIRFSPEFGKQFEQRLTNLQKIRVLDVFDLFQSKPFYEDLRNNPLRGEWLGHRSISIGGDLRLHFMMLAKKLLTLSRQGLTISSIIRQSAPTR